MKYAATKLKYLQELVMFSDSIPGNYFFNTLFGDFNAETCNAVESYMQFEVLHFTQTIELNCTIVYTSKKLCRI